VDTYLKATVEHHITACIDECRWEGVHTAWKPPLIAYAGAQDPLFEQFKEIIGPGHLTPRELLPGAESVIAYFLPFRERVAHSNRREGPASSPWAHAYIETNTLIATINRRLIDALERDGYATVAPPPTHVFDKSTLVSDWSHKHVAYVAGLGTFGLHHMLITAEGCAGRLGTLVTNAYARPTPRYDHEACLYKHNGSCTACVERCTFNALTVDAFDRRACYRVCQSNSALFAELGHADVCGKCVSVVPCSYTDPVARGTAAQHTVANSNS
jgi:epoxyqueuosine reductase QueG